MSRMLFSLSDVLNSEEKIEWPENADEEAIVGGIILNRLVGIAYDKIPFDKLNKENKKILAVLKSFYEEQYDKFMDKLHFLSKVLKDAEFDYALLKGAFLTPKLYKRGQRISNDIDILVSAKDLSEIQDLLISAGFVQGHCDETGCIVPATRREIVFSRLNHGETIPFLRYLNDELIEVDLNFSLDFKAVDSDENVSLMLKNAIDYEFDNITMKTLCHTDFLIHLCCHLFKEATTFEWLVHRRDLMLYKFCDIYMFIHEYGNNTFFESLAYEIKKYGVQKECYYSFARCAEIYPNIKSTPGFVDMLESIKPTSLEYLSEVIHPIEKKIYKYDISFTEWFECSNRIAKLKEKV